ncbi:hypothetical protein [Ralstonia phage RP13]|nr:hypothetical protein [Ralstonia phage RP13]
MKATDFIAKVHAINEAKATGRNNFLAILHNSALPDEYKTPLLAKIAITTNSKFYKNEIVNVCKSLKFPDNIIQDIINLSGTY